MNYVQQFAELCFFGSSNYVRKASELCFDNLNLNCARRTAEMNWCLRSGRTTRNPGPRKFPAFQHGDGVNIQRTVQMRERPHPVGGTKKFWRARFNTISS